MVRFDLDGESWLDYAPGWLAGDSSLYQSLVESVPWEQPEVRMYERKLKTPRLVGRVEVASHPVLGEIVELASDRYEIRLDRVSAGWYRTGPTSPWEPVSRSGAGT